MAESAISWRATGLSIGLHGLLLAMLYLGLIFHREQPPLSVAGGAIEAVLTEALVVPVATPPARPAAPPPTPVQPKPEPRPQTETAPPKPEPQTPVTRPDTVDQERVVREAAQQAEAKRVQEERQRQEQILLEEEKCQQEEIERRQRLAQQQAEREQQLADIRRQREQAEARRRQEEEKLEQLRAAREEAATQASAPSTSTSAAQQLGNQGVDDALLGRYRLAIQQQVDRNWLRPDNLQPGLRCIVEVTQLRGGDVSGVDFARCQTDELTRRSIEAALMREPLPYAGYESVYQRKLAIPFCYPLEACRR